MVAIFLVRAFPYVPWQKGPQRYANTLLYIMYFSFVVILPVFSSMTNLVANIIYIP